MMNWLTNLKTAQKLALGFGVCLALAAIIGFFFALVVGLSTLRLRGVYFVIFTFGLTELMRQVSSWYEINVTHKLNRFITISVSSIVIYEMLLVLAAAAVVGSWYVSTTRLGHALRAIGDFRYVGFFKRVRDSSFARLDTLAYSPLCAGLAVLIGISAGT